MGLRFPGAGIFQRLDAGPVPPLSFFCIPRVWILQKGLRRFSSPPRPPRLVYVLVSTHQYLVFVSAPEVYTALAVSLVSRFFLHLFFVFLVIHVCVRCVVVIVVEVMHFVPLINGVCMCWVRTCFGRDSSNVRLKFWSCWNVLFYSTYSVQMILMGLER